MPKGKKYVEVTIFVRIPVEYEGVPLALVLPQGTEIEMDKPEPPEPVDPFDDVPATPHINGFCYESGQESTYCGRCAALVCDPSIQCDCECHVLAGARDFCFHKKGTFKRCYECKGEVYQRYAPDNCDCTCHKDAIRRHCMFNRRSYVNQDEAACLMCGVRADSPVAYRRQCPCECHMVGHGSRSGG